MNIDSLNRLVQSSDISELRTIAATFLPMIGVNSADFCDGPYDGGKDYTVSEDKVKGIRFGIQLSVEKEWKDKIEKDALKTKNRYGTNLLYFISSRRIPESSFDSLRDDLLINTGVSVVRYDSQAIASRYIKNNKVETLLAIFGLANKDIPERIRKYLGASNEAISAYLLFDDKAKDYRSRLFDSLVKSALARSEDGKSREQLIESVIREYSLSATQSQLINSHIDRLLQKGEVVSEKGVIRLSQSEKATFLGLIQSSQFEANALQREINLYLDGLNTEIDKTSKELLIENYLALTIYLAGNTYHVEQNDNKHNDSYSAIRDILITKYGKNNATKIFTGLADVVSKSNFTKKVASAKLYEALLNSNSIQLISALGGSESINVYFDSSVVIPIICGLLYETTNNRFSQAGGALYSLIKNHEFNAVIPDVYMEEVAAHLIEACRDYRYILQEDIDLSYSGNAFVSHYCSYIRKSGDRLSFVDYVKVFGVRINAISADMPDSSFFSLRDRIAKEITRLSERYDFEIVEVISRNISKEKARIEDILYDENLSKPDILVSHDARIIQYLSSDNVQSGYVKLLCTWDRLHAHLNPDGREGYYVMNPVALIDYLSAAKIETNDYQLSQLVDFAYMQSQRDIELSSKIWDSIAKLDKEKLSDARLMLEAKKFQENFLVMNSNMELLDSAKIEQEWMVWKKTKSIHDSEG